MTKEKAIKMLKSKMDGHTDTSYEWAETVRMAIKALEQKPCDDCISREETLKALMDEWTEYDRELIDYLFEKIDKLPSVTPQPKVGRWIKYGVPRCGEQHYKCTSCGYYINFGQWGELYTKEFKYCPSCGAKMQEVE